MPNISFSEAYKIQIKAIWYANGSLPAQKAIDLKIFPPDEHGNVVSVSALGHWIKDDSWHQWKDVMDANLAVKVEDEILESRVAEVERQLQQNIQISDKAFKAIMDKDFDSSAAANQAFFKANYEVRGLMQFQKVIADMTRMETPEIREKLRELAERANATVIEGTVEEKDTEPLD